MIYSQSCVVVFLYLLLIFCPRASSAEDRSAQSLAQASRSKILDRQVRNVEELWAKWSEMMREYTTHQISYHKNPQDSGWISWFLGNEGSQLDEIKEISSQLLSHLRASEAQNLKEKYFILRDTIEAARLESIQLAEDSYLAPEDGEAWFFQNSKEDYKELIKAKKDAIMAMKNEQRQLIQDCHDSLVSMGIELTEGQVRQLFQMKSGGAILDLLVTFAHLNMLLELLTERMNPDITGEQYAEQSERYYSVYVALIGLSLDLHRETQRRLKEEDLAELDQINQNLQQMVKETQAAIVKESKQSDAESTENIVKSYQENLKTQQEIIRASKEYRTLIENQLKSIHTVELELERHWKLALNTYQTARVSNNYYGIVNRGLRDLNNLRKLKIPSMIPLMSDRLSSKMNDLDQYRGQSIDDLRPKR